MKKGMILVFAGAAALWAGRADADEERFSLELRGGGFDRDDGGYADHAEVYGLSNPELAGGGVIEGGVRFLPRLWLLGSWSGWSTSGARRLSELDVENRAVLAHVGFTAYREEFETDDVAWWLRADVSAGAGLYTISDDLDGEGHRDRGPGARLGAQIAAGWRGVGLALSYGWHLTDVHIDDRVGGTLNAGGHEFGAGLRFQY
jgi:hypothetical protein